MTALVLCWCLSQELVPAAGVPPREQRVSILAGDLSYRSRKEAEQVFVGELESARTEKEGTHPLQLRFQDTNGGVMRLPVHAPGKTRLLERYVGRQVRITGKVVRVTGAGRSYHELWPGRLEEMSNPLARGPGKDGVYVRCAWQPAEARRFGVRTYCFRDGKQLAEALHLSGDTASQTATILLARQLGVPEIDWKKYMLVTVSGGLRTDAHALTITAVKGSDGVLRVRYRLTPPRRGSGGFAYPAETVLVNRHEGEVRFEREQQTNTPDR